MTNLCIILTGGTLDKVHDTYTEGLSFPGDASSHMDDLLRIGRSTSYEVIPIMQKDSLEMTQADREAILRAVLDAAQTQIVITHGTGTMEDTAQFLDGKTGSKTVVLTGAMRPFSLGKSDAGFNVGGAIIAAQTLPAGVYGVMNGRVFGAQHLRKDKKAGRFDL